MSPPEGSRKGPTEDIEAKQPRQSPSWKETMEWMTKKSLQFAFEHAVSNLPLILHEANYQRIHFKVDSEAKLQKLK